MVFGDFNDHYPSRFSRTGDDRAAGRGEALDGVIDSLQLAVANQDLPTHLPSRYHPSERAASSRCDMVHPYHPYVLPLPSLVMPRPHRGKLIPTQTSTRLTGRDSQQSQRGDSLKHLCQPPALLGRSLQAYPQQRRKTPHPLWLC